MRKSSCYFISYMRHKKHKLLVLIKIQHKLVLQASVSDGAEGMRFFLFGAFSASHGAKRGYNEPVKLIAL